MRVVGGQRFGSESAVSKEMERVLVQMGGMDRLLGPAWAVNDLLGTRGMPSGCCAIELDSYW